MASKIEVKSSGGISFLGALFLVFLTLKLCGVIDWSWWFVTMPLYAPLALFLCLCVVTLPVFVVVALIKGVK